MKLQLRPISIAFIFSLTQLAASQTTRHGEPSNGNRCWNYNRSSSTLSIVARYTCHSQLLWVKLIFVFLSLEELQISRSNHMIQPRWHSRLCKLVKILLLPNEILSALWKMRWNNVMEFGLAGNVNVRRNSGWERSISWELIRWRPAMADSDYVKIVDANKQVSRQ